MIFLCEMCCCEIDDDVSFCDDCFEKMPNDQWVTVDFYNSEWKEENGS